MEDRVRAIEDSYGAQIATVLCLREMEASQRRMEARQETDE